MLKSANVRFAAIGKFELADGATMKDSMEEGPTTPCQAANAARDRDERIRIALDRIILQVSAEYRMLGMSTAKWKILVQ